MIKAMSTWTRYLPAIIILMVGTAIAAVASITQAAPTGTKVATAPLQTREDLITHDQQFVIFHSKVFLNRNKTRVSFPFAFPEEEPPLIAWFGFNPTSEPNRFDILVSHPQLMDLSWEVVAGNKLYLHQRQTQYEDIESFINNPPEDLSRVRIDAYLKKIYPQFDQARETDQEFDVSQVDYVLTTFNHSTYKDGVYYFNRIIDATNAAISAAEEIEWYLTVPTAGEDEVEYYLGTFDINYLQI